MRLLFCEELCIIQCHTAEAYPQDNRTFATPGLPGTTSCGRDIRVPTSALQDSLEARMPGKSNGMKNFFPAPPQGVEVNAVNCKI